MYFDGDENYQRGYEWWMMKEAKQVSFLRNLGYPHFFPTLIPAYFDLCCSLA